MQGFLDLNKPAGLTSHDCVARVRRIIRLKRVGHGGTLDPAATGVLPIALGKATRLLQFLRQDKAYRATIRLGLRTTTDDLEGEIIAAQPVGELSIEVVKAALEQFQGTIQQVPPSYSAIQVQGKRLYDLARAGKTVDVPARLVEVYKIEILDWRSGEFPELDVAIACGPGTYIRAIARDLGAALNIGGTLASLIRTQSCGLHLGNSLTLEQLEQHLQQGTFQPIPPDAALSHLAAITLAAAEAKRWCQGQKISDLAGTEHSPASDSAESHKQVPNLNPPDESGESKIVLRVYDEDSRFLGIGSLVNSADGQLLIPQMVFEPL